MSPYYSSSIFPVYPIYQYQLNFWENSYPDIYLQSYLPTYQYISQYQYISIHYPIVSIVYPNKSSISSVYPIFPNVHSLWVTAVKKGYQFHALGESGASPGRCPGGILHGNFLGIWDGFQINFIDFYKGYILSVFPIAPPCATQKPPNFLGPFDGPAKLLQLGAVDPSLELTLMGLATTLRNQTWLGNPRTK